MTETSRLAYYRTHSPITDPGPPYSAMLDALPATISEPELVRLREVIKEAYDLPVGSDWQAHCADVLERGFEQETMAAFVIEGEQGRLASACVGCIYQHLPGMRPRSRSSSARAAW
jgi:hypothetical protein